MYPWSLLTILNFFMRGPTDATVFNVSSSSRRDNKRTVPLRGSVAAGNYETFSFSITGSPQSWSYFTRNLPCEISRKKAVISPSFLAWHSNHKLTIFINTSNWQPRSHGHTTFITILWLRSYYAHQNNQMWLWWGWRNNWV